MKSTRLLGLALAGYTAFLAGAWEMEHRARAQAEIERDRALADLKSQRLVAARDRGRGAVPAAAPDEGVPASPPKRPAPRPPVIAMPAGGRDDPHAPVNAAALHAPSTGGFVLPLRVDNDPAGSLDRLVAAWKQASPSLSGQDCAQAWNLVFGELDALAKLAGGALADPLERIMRSEASDTQLYYSLFYALNIAAPERAQNLVRQQIDSPDPQVRGLAVSNLFLLPEAEAISACDRFLRDPDPEVWHEALARLPGQGAQYADVLERVAAVETDPVRRGEMLAGAFHANPDPAQFDRLLRHLDMERDPQLRTAVLTGIKDHLTMRDTSAVSAIRRIALDPTETKDVREAAFAAILDGQQPVLGPAERDALEDTRDRLLEEKD